MASKINIAASEVAHDVRTAKLPPGAVVLYLWLADLATTRNQHPVSTYLSEVEGLTDVPGCGLSPNSIRKALDDLESRGVVEVIRKKEERVVWLHIKLNCAGD